MKKGLLWVLLTIALLYTPIFKEKEIFLTFDDGPIPPYTIEIASTLEKEGARGTFFLVGKKVIEHGSFVRELSEKGHTIGNHTFSHNRFNQESVEESLEDLIRGEVVLAEQIGYFTKLYRPPGGGISRIKREIFEDLGFKAVFWDVNTRDFENRGSLYIILKTILISWDKSIVLMHSCPSASKSLPALVKILKFLNFNIKALPTERFTPPSFPTSEIVKINERQKLLLKLIGMESFIEGDVFLLERALSNIRNYNEFNHFLSNVRAFERKAATLDEELFWRKEKRRLEIYIRRTILRRKLLECLISNILSLPEKAY